MARLVIVLVTIFAVAVGSYLFWSVKDQDAGLADTPVSTAPQRRSGDPAAQKQHHDQDLPERQGREHVMPEGEKPVPVTARLPEEGGHSTPEFLDEINEPSIQGPEETFDSGALVVAPEAMDTGQPGLAPEAFDTGIAGPAPEAYDAGIPGQAPEAGEPQATPMPPDGEGVP